MNPSDSNDPTNPTDPSDSNDPTNPTDPSTVYFHCLKCKRVFLSLSQRRAHVRQDCCNPQTFVCDTDHDHSPIEIEFSTMDEALAWRFDEEHDRYFSIRQSRKNFKHFHCSQKHEGKKQERVKNSKKVHNCPAKFMFNQRRLCHCDISSTTQERCSSYKDVVQVRGCLEHSHPLERRNIHLSKKTKDNIVDLLKSGLQTSVILEKHFPPSRENPTSKPVTADDIYRLEKTNNLQGYNSKVSEVENLTALMSGLSFRGFNYGHKFEMSHFSEDVQAKVVNTDGQFLICYASPEMIERFKNHPFTVAIDGTHGTNASKFILISVNVMDSRGEGSPIFQCLVESENQKIFSSALRILKSLAPEACSQTRVLLTDLSHTFINSWREVINPDVTWSPCHWHLERSWARHIQNSRILSEIKNLRRIANREDFLNEASKIKMK